MPVHYDLADHVATITLDRPERHNAIDGALRRDLNATFTRFREDEDAWVGIVAGAGPSFCAGADLGSETGNPAGDFAGTYWERPTVNSFESGWEIFKPMIAAVHGNCLGYGLTMVSWCDFVIAAESTRFGMPEARKGIPTIVGALRLPQKLNWQYAMELLLTGEPIDAARAHEIGLAGWVVPDAELADAARALAARLTRGAPLAQRAIKEMAVRGPQLPTVEAIRFGETMRRVVKATEDAAEGAAALRERREPRWRGR